MISNEQIFETIAIEILVRRVGELKKEGWRLAAISGARIGETLELLYSFDRDCRLLTLRMDIAIAEKVPSISSHYFCAVLYENELHDLFGLRVEGIAVDFKGNLYRTTVKYPFGSTKAPGPQPTATTTTSTLANAPAASSTTTSST